MEEFKSVTPPASVAKRRQPWRPTKHLEPSRPPRDEQIKEEIYNNSVAAAEQWGGALDFAGRAPKRLKPRRTVDYSAGAARWQTVGPSSGGLHLVFLFSHYRC